VTHSPGRSPNARPVGRYVIPAWKATTAASCFCCRAALWIGTIGPQFIREADDLWLRPISNSSITARYRSLQPAAPRSGAPCHPLSRCEASLSSSGLPYWLGNRRFLTTLTRRPGRWRNCVTETAKTHFKQAAVDSSVSNYLRTTKSQEHGGNSLRGELRDPGEQRGPLGKIR
jgi:hypothetical protein